MRIRHYIQCFVMLLLIASVPTALAQDENLDADAMSETFYLEFNRIVREEYSASALSRNPILDSVAEQIATRIGCSDERIEFSIQQEVKARGYTTYPGDNTVRTTRIPLLPVVNLRPIEEMAAFYTGDIYANNINQSGRFYREIGVGVSPCRATTASGAQGSTQQYGLFVILGAQPDVIPVVIENGERELDVAGVPVTVTLSVHQEDSRPREGIFGAGASVRLSNEPLTEDIPSQPYNHFIAWELESCGKNTVYYELTDEANLTVTGNTSIELNCE